MLIKSCSFERSSVRGPRAGAACKREGGTERKRGRGAESEKKRRASVSSAVHLGLVAAAPRVFAPVGAWFSAVHSKRMPRS